MNLETNNHDDRSGALKIEQDVRKAVRINPTDGETGEQTVSLWRLT